MIKHTNLLVGEYVLCKREVEADRIVQSGLSLRAKSGRFSLVTFNMIAGYSHMKQRENRTLLMNFLGVQFLPTNCLCQAT